MCTSKDMLANYLGAMFIDDVMRSNTLISSIAPSRVFITRVCDEHLFGQVSTSTGCNKLPILEITASMKYMHSFLFNM